MQRCILLKSWTATMHFTICPFSRTFPLVLVSWLWSAFLLYLLEVAKVKLFLLPKPLDALVLRHWLNGIFSSIYVGIDWAEKVMGAASINWFRLTNVYSWCCSLPIPSLWQKNILFFSSLIPSQIAWSISFMAPECSWASLPTVPPNPPPTHPQTTPQHDTVVYQLGC